MERSVVISAGFKDQSASLVADWLEERGESGESEYLRLTEWLEAEEPGFSDGHGYGDGDGHGYGYGHGDGYGDGHRYGYGHGDGYGYGDGYGDS